jgi:glycosyltransferase involved in cell wall biosynthesis
MPTCAFLSFRLGENDGVSVVAREWMRAFESFGFDIRSVAGAGPVDCLVPGLAIGAIAPPDPGELEDALDGADLVVVENLLTIPMNLPASTVAVGVLRGRPALLHHHDPPWQRARYREVTALPVDDPRWRHVTINRLTAEQFGERGIDAEVVYNGFDVEPRPGDRLATRAALGVDPDERLLVHPVRAIERKSIPHALALAHALHATYWLTGPPEEGFDHTLHELLSSARGRVVHQAVDDIDDLYAAADLVIFPSTWEGFGNPPIEASIRQRPVAVGRYPVLEELTALGFDWLSVADTAAIEAFLHQPDHEVLAMNRDLAHRHFSRDQMHARLRALLDDAGWLP